MIHQLSKTQLHTTYTAAKSVTFLLLISYRKVTKEINLASCSFMIGVQRNLTGNQLNPIVAFAGIR